MVFSNISQNIVWNKLLNTTSTSIKNYTVTLRIDEHHFHLVFWLLIFFIASFAVCFATTHIIWCMFTYSTLGICWLPAIHLKWLIKKYLRWTSGWGTFLISCWYRITFVRICAWSCHLYIVFGLLPWIFIMSDDPLKIIYGVFYALKLSVVMVLPPPPPHTHTVIKLAYFFYFQHFSSLLLWLLMTLVLLYIILLCINSLNINSHS